MDHFENLFSDAKINENDKIEDLQIDQPNDEIENLIFNGEISEDESLKALKKWKEKNQQGQIGFCPSSLSNLAILLPYLFKRLFKCGSFPKGWSDNTCTNS